MSVGVGYNNYDEKCTYPYLSVVLLVTNYATQDIFHQGSPAHFFVSVKTRFDFGAFSREGISYAGENKK